MSVGRAQDAKRLADSSDVLPSAPQTPRRSEAAISADDLAKLAEQINWPRLPYLKEFEQMAEMIPPAGYCSSAELADTASAERAQIYKILSEGRSGWARLLRKILDAKSPPAEVEAGKSRPYKEVNIFGAI